MIRYIHTCQTCSKKSRRHLHAGGGLRAWSLFFLSCKDPRWISLSPRTASIGTTEFESWLSKCWSRCGLPFCLVGGCRFSPRSPCGLQQIGDLGLWRAVGLLSRGCPVSLKTNGVCISTDLESCFLGIVFPALSLRFLSADVQDQASRPVMLDR